MKALRLILISILTLVYNPSLLALDSSMIEIEGHKLKEIKLIKKNFKTKSKELRSQIHNKMDKIDKMLTGSESEKEILQTFSELTKLRLTHQNMRIHTILKIRKILPVSLRGHLKDLKGPRRHRHKGGYSQHD